MLITIAGLLGTYLLPWPSGDESRQAGTQRQIEPVQIEACAEGHAGEGSARRCDSLPVRAPWRSPSLMQPTRVRDRAEV